MNSILNQLTSRRKKFTSGLSLLWLKTAKFLPPLRKEALGPMPHPNSIAPFACTLSTRPLSVFTILMHSSPQGQQITKGNSR